MPDRPAAGAMVPCDHVHVDPQSTRPCLMGPFYEASTPSIPFVFGPMALHAALTNVSGSHVASVTILDPDDEEVPDPYQEFPVEIADEKHRFQIYFLFENITFYQAGEYLFVLRLSGEIVETCRLDVNLVGEP